MKWPSEGEAHQWRSDPAKGLPQWLEADFGRRATLNTVYLTFDTNIFGGMPSRKPGAEVTAQDYRLLYNDDGQWKVAFSEHGNWRRFRRHRFNDITTDKIRLEILKARNGTRPGCMRSGRIKNSHREKGRHEPSWRCPLAGQRRNRR